MLCCGAAAAGPTAAQRCSAGLPLRGRVPTTPVPIPILLNTIIQRQLWLCNASHRGTEAVRGSSSRSEGRMLFLVVSFVVRGCAYLSEGFSPCPLLPPALLSPAYSPSQRCQAHLSRETIRKASGLAACSKPHWQMPSPPRTKADPMLHHHPQEIGKANLYLSLISN